MKPDVIYVEYLKPFVLSGCVRVIYKLRMENTVLDWAVRDFSWSKLDPNIGDSVSAADCPRMENLALTELMNNLRNEKLFSEHIFEAYEMEAVRVKSEN